jgi:hypothetical protein
MTFSLRQVSALLLIFVSLLGLVPQRQAVDLDSVKVVSFYEGIEGADMPTLISQLADTGTQVVFRAFWKGRAVDLGTFSILEERIREIKAKLPWIQIMGGMTGSLVGYPGDYWPNGTLISHDAAEQMLWTTADGSFYPSPYTLPARIPVLDILKPLAREFVEAYAYRFVDVGFDSLYFDQMDTIPSTAENYGLKVGYQPYIDAWGQIVAAVKDYSMRKYSRQFYVTAFSEALDPQGNAAFKPWPYQDFISVSMNPASVKDPSAQTVWSRFRAQVIEVYGHAIPIMVFMDYGCTSVVPQCPIEVFASHPRDVQIQLLKKLHDTALRDQVLLVYPLHGGGIKKAPYVYDAINQGTFDTIRQLANSQVTVYTMLETTTVTTTVYSTLRENPLPNTTILSVLVVVLFVALVIVLVYRQKRNSGARALPT